MKNMYGPIEFTYCNPVVTMLAENDDFRTWFLRETKFSELAAPARSLKSEQMQLDYRVRGRYRQHWWRDYNCGDRCQCNVTGLDGKKRMQTDAFVVFEVLLLDKPYRFAVHIECKQPGEKINDRQGEGYRVRSKCWSGAERRPRTVLEHHDAISILICSQGDFRGIAFGI